MGPPLLGEVEPEGVGGAEIAPELGAAPQATHIRYLKERSDVEGEVVGDGAGAHQGWRHLSVVEK